MSRITAPRRQTFILGVSICGDWACKRPAVGWLLDEDDTPVGGIVCRECADACVDEYHAKLGWRWRLVEGETVEQDNGLRIRRLSL